MEHSYIGEMKHCGDDLLDSHQFVFNFGRCMCPDCISADNTLFATLAHWLTMYKVPNVVGTVNRVVELVAEIQSKAAGHRAPFVKTIHMRSKQNRALPGRFEQRYRQWQSDVAAPSNPGSWRNRPISRSSGRCTTHWRHREQLKRTRVDIHYTIVCPLKSAVIFYILA